MEERVTLADQNIRKSVTPPIMKNFGTVWPVSQMAVFFMAIVRKIR